MTAKERRLRAYFMDRHARRWGLRDALILELELRKSVKAREVKRP